MKRYLLTLKKTNIRWFECEKEMADFLIAAGAEADQYRVEAVECSSISSTDGRSMLESIIRESNRESSICAALGDDYAEKAIGLIRMLERLAPKDPFRPDEMRESAKKVFERLSACEKTREKFSKEVKRNSEYLLYCVSSSIEWYSSILATCPIKSLSEICRTEQANPLTKAIKMVGHRTPEIMMNNFEKAKGKMKKA